MGAKLTRQVALLRGINVGRNKRIAMADLRELLTGLGYGDVETLLASGNATFSSPHAPATAAKRISTAIEERFGFDVAVLVRTADEIAAVVDANPFADVATSGKQYLVAFLDAKPPTAKLDAFLGADLGDDRVEVGDGVIYLWCARGILESTGAKLLSDRTLGVPITTRNWNTVEKLHALLQG